MNISFLSAIRRFRVSATLAAVVYLALGFFLFAAPDTAYRTLGLIIAVSITAYGALNVLSFLISREEGIYAVDLLIGVCALAFGIFSLVNPTFLTNFLLVVLGLMGVVGSVNGITRALNLRSMGYPKWALPLAPSIITLLVALSVVFLPDMYGNLMMAVIGVMLVVEAASDLFSLHELSKLTKA